MKNLSAALSAALGAPVQRPALLIEAGFATVRRWSSFATVAWNGNTWAAEAVDVQGLQVQPLRVAGTLVLNNLDGVAGALVLAEGVQDRSFRIWGYDAAATALADVVWLCDAVGAGAEVDDAEVAITLRHRSEFTFGPRTFVNPYNGFTQLQPAGTVLRINGLDFRLERAA
jgi:hypothetical protein